MEGVMLINGVDEVGNVGVVILDIECNSFVVCIGFKFDDVIVGVNCKCIFSVLDFRNVLDDVSGVIVFNVKWGNFMFYFVIC